MNSGEAFDYIIVGSGAGGGTLAARLAEAGRKVLLLEAGGDPRLLSGTNDYQPGIDRLPDDYDVPSFHGFASENDAMRWDLFVRHYADEAMQAKDPKYVRDYRGQPVNGVLYPRAGTLGGCTAHNAMILVYPHNADWDGIAQLTGDPSWNARAMRRYSRDHRRMGTRERVLETAQKFPDRLHLELDALVTRIVLDANKRATGVEYLKGKRLYRAHGQPATAPGAAMHAEATREVILCGGAFNTPQLLMLSGIGPRDVLEPLGIPLRIASSLWSASPGCSSAAIRPRSLISFVSLRTKRMPATTESRSSPVASLPSSK